MASIRYISLSILPHYARQQPLTSQAPATLGKHPKKRGNSLSLSPKCLRRWPEGESRQLPRFFVYPSTKQMTSGRPEPPCIMAHYRAR